MCGSKKVINPPAPEPIAAVPVTAQNQKIPELDLAIESDNDRDTKKKSSKRTGKKSLRSDGLAVTPVTSLNIPN